MISIKHKFLTHKIHPETETLIIGTFNPNAEKNQADFFYGRGRNFLWRLLPVAYEDADLTGKSREEKIDFIHKRKIDFIDIISEVEIDNGEEANYKDNYLDSRVSEWRDVKNEIENLKKIKRVCITRKTFSDIPKMKVRIDEIQKYCEERHGSIDFKYLITPARYYSTEKQNVWTKFLKNDNR